MNMPLSTGNRNEGDLAKGRGTRVAVEVEGGMLSWASMRKEKKMSRAQKNESTSPTLSSSPVPSTPPKFVWGARHWWAVGLGLIGVVIVGVSFFVAAPNSTAPIYGYEVLQTYPHDSNAFCQGLSIEGETLYEGTGLYQHSNLRQVDLKSGKVTKSVNLSSLHFGEGITVVGDEIFQLTWKNRECFVYDKATLRRTGRRTYRGEGWGLTHDGKQFILSDGSHILQFLDPTTFRVTRTIKVQSQGRLVDKLNELEFVEGEIFANIWYSDYIARISPTTGEVLGWLDLSGILPAHERKHKDAVLNGIAYDAQEKRLFVTGKHWPKLFEIKIVKK